MHYTKPRLVLSETGLFFLHSLIAYYRFTAKGMQWPGHANNKF